MKAALIPAFCGLVWFLPAQTAPGTVHIYRIRGEIATRTRTTVSCDNFPVARIENGHVFTMRMSVGRHVVGTSDRPLGFFIDVASGGEYFVRIDYPVNASLPTGAAPVLVPNDEGRMEITKLKPLDGRFIEAGMCGK
jgi:hypothetical protein